MKGDDYLRGRHFWTHFWCGVVVGALLGARLFWSVFESRWAFFGCTAGFTLVFAAAVGHWGDPLWRKLLDLWD